jgi:hypothetical protein
MSDLRSSWSDLVMDVKASELGLHVRSESCSASYVFILATRQHTSEIYGYDYIS